MRLTHFLALFFLIFAAGSLQAKPLKLKSLDTAYYSNGHAFKHISEYFSGKENTLYRAVVRSSDEVRSGFYFIIKLNQKLKKLPEGSTAELSYVNSANPDSQTQVFALPRLNTSELYLGLTGSDWEGSSVGVLAWDLVIKGPEDELLLEAHSFLSKESL